MALTKIRQYKIQSTMALVIDLSNYRDIIIIIIIIVIKVNILTKYAFFCHSIYTDNFTVVR